MKLEESTEKAELPTVPDPPLFGRLVGGPEAGWFSVGPAATAAMPAPTGPTPPR